MKGMMIMLTSRQKALIFTTFALLCAILAVVAMLNGGGSSTDGDPTGATLGTVSEIPAAVVGSPTIDEVSTQVAKNKLGINYVWVFLCGMLIFFFQAGFALVETGFTQGKNALHTMAMNFVVFFVGAVGYYMLGFGLQFGGVGGWASLGGAATLNHEVSIFGWGLFGTKGFMLTTGGTYDVAVYALFFFQMVFMDTTSTIPTGSMAERVKFSAVVASSFFVSMLYYPLFGNWMWGGGWLAQLGTHLGLGHGAVDFAGSSVVHAMGGMIALSGAMVIGPRIGKFAKDGTPRAFPGHDIPMAIFGTLILFFGWFAFNAGSTMNGTDLRLAVVATNTMIAGSVGALIAMFYMWIRYGKPDISMTCNGGLAGLVAITAPCAFVNSIASFAIGIVSGILVCVAVEIVERKWKLDDPVGAVAVHGFNGIWGMLALGLFADGTYGEGLNGVAGNVRGLFYGDPSQLTAQLISIVTIIIYGFGFSYIFWKILDKILGIRVKAEDEIGGLDIPEMGVLAYPDFLSPSGSTVAAYNTTQFIPEDALPHNPREN